MKSSVNTLCAATVKQIIVGLTQKIYLVALKCLI